MTGRALIVLNCRFHLSAIAAHAPFLPIKKAPLSRCYFLYFLDFFEIFFKQAIDNHLKMWYNNIVRREVKAMIDKIKELIKLLEQLNKLLLKVIELAGTVTLLVLAIKQIAEIF